MANARGRFCYTLDVLTDGSENTGCGSLFLSVWKIPLSIRNQISAEDSSDSESFSSSGDEESSSEEEHEQNDMKPDNSDESLTETNSNPYSWLTGAGSAENDNGRSAVPHDIPTPIARYAISGLGDATARLCADQRFKLAPTRACFLPTLAGGGEGLSALLLALYGAGSPSLHVVVPKCRKETNGNGFVEDLASLVLGNYKNMDIRTCEVGGCDDSSTALTWWRVYEDDHLIVHSSDANGFLASLSEGYGMKDNSPSLIYLYSFPTTQLGQKQNKTTGIQYFTLALLPPRCNGMSEIYEQFMRQNRPMIKDDIAMTSIDCVLFLDPRQPLDKSSLSCKLPSQILTTLPQNNHENQHPDEGILIRSQQLHRHFHRSIPWAFAPPCNFNSSRANVVKDNANESILVLKSGISIVLETSSEHPIPNERIWDRRKSIWKKPPKEEATRSFLASLKSFTVGKSAKPASKTPATEISDENEIDLEDESDSEEETSKEVIEDENEINLHDEEEDENSKDGKKSQIATAAAAVVNDDENAHGTDNETNLSEPNIATCHSGARLLVLGTGCATPSAYRGSSGYALVLPSTEHVLEATSHSYCYENTVVGSFHRHTTTERDSETNEIYLLDCGEGVATMLSRNCGQLVDWKRRIRGVWISHAHLDHYGGLPTLLRLLLEERRADTNQANHNDNRSRKRPRHSISNNIVVPWVIAPPKVFRYLDLVLGCKHGRSKDGSEVYFEPKMYHDPRTPSYPFCHFESIKVYHNCCPAFGLLVGWRRRGSTQFLCYSGDTRPSHNLVRACNRTAKGDLFLIHEATFRNAEATMAEKKKHSTLCEAWEVASNISNCSRVLMTHFSQRYDAVEEESLECEWKGTKATKTAGSPCVGLAVDGLWINLD